MSYLCLKRDIKDGEYATFSIFGDEVIAKSDKGRITVAKNSCKHRGFKVASCAGRGPIKCQYHGQRFEYEKRYSHHEFGEFLFVPTYLASSQIFPKFSQNLGKEFGGHKMFVRAPFHLWMQNTADPNHLTTAHKNSFSKLFDGTRVESVYVSEFESSYTMRIKDEIVDRYASHYSECSDHFYHALGFPNLSVTSFLNIFYSVESANPADGGCEVTTRFFMRTDLEPGLIGKVALESNIKILEEDRKLVEAWAVNYRYEPDTQWLPGEMRIKRYADEIRARQLE